MFPESMMKSRRCVDKLLIIRNNNSPMRKMNKAPCWKMLPIFENSFSP